MHFESNQGSLNCGEVDEVVHDAPIRSDLVERDFQNGFHEEFDIADNELSDDDDEIPLHHDEEFINPAFDLEALNIEDDNLQAGQEEPVIFNYFEFIFSDDDDSSSSSEMSDDQADRQEIVEPKNEQQNTSNNPESENLNSAQQDASYHAHLNNVEVGALSHVDINITNEIEKTHSNSTQEGASYNLDNHDLINVPEGALKHQEINVTMNEKKNDIDPNLLVDESIKFVECDHECSEAIAISTPKIETTDSPIIYYGPHNSGFETPESRGSDGPSNSGY